MRRRSFYFADPLFSDVLRRVVLIQLENFAKVGLSVKEIRVPIPRFPGSSAVSVLGEVKGNGGR